MYSPSRTEALDRQSRDYLQLALDTPPTNRAAAGAAYQAGYLALMGALTVDEVAAIADHPSASAAALAARRLQLPAEDQALATEGAAGYYSPVQGVGRPLAEQIAWARRIRLAVHWAP
ncbi:MAG: hypothetical protein JOY88_20105 [Pelomonas sp.]|nr:hypothetical protein [Roseateles sp.]